MRILHEQGPNEDGTNVLFNGKPCRAYRCYINEHGHICYDIDVTEPAEFFTFNLTLTPSGTELDGLSESISQEE